MRSILDLCNLAKQQNIEIIQYPMTENGSMSIMFDDGSCYIGIDKKAQDAGPQERVHLGHELGHCLTGSFYNIYAAIDCRRKHENQADKWAIQELVPIDQLDDAVAGGLTEIWDLAEHFGVTEEFLKKAVCWYTYGNLATELYF